MAPGPATSASRDRDVLPRNVHPIHYDLTLDPSIETLDFKGRAHIRAKALEDSQSITLHAADLNILSISLATDGPGDFAGDELVSLLDLEKETLTIRLSQTIKAKSSFTLSLTFTGRLKESIAGLFRASYKDRNNRTQWMIASQMQPTDARRVLPCFDEPGFKASFTVTLLVDKPLICLSNMPVNFIREIPDCRSRKSVTFHPTPLMSTYLLALAIGDFQVLEALTFRLPLRLYVTSDHNVEDGPWGLELSARTLEFFEKEFGIPYALPKLDTLVIPNYLGAMENWGLVTYDQVRFLWSETKADAEQKQLVASTIQHELAHQWFGNLVTMDYWNGLWLNEGFATWASEIYTNDIFFPDWQVRQQFISNHYHSALKLDGLRCSHPVEVPVLSTDKIDQVFDDIAYSKGACVLRMIASSLGEKIFLKGVRLYLRRHSWSNTTTDDLWAALSDVSNRDVEVIVGVWTRKVGFPVVEVLESGDRIVVVQHRFLRTGDVQPEEDEVLYPIFLALRTTDGVNSNLMLTKREDEVPISGSNFIKLNTNHVGFFRTLYGGSRLRKLSSSRHSLSIDDRIGIVGDAVSLASAGHQRMSDVLDLLWDFRDETEYVVWNEMLDGVTSLRAAWMLEDEHVQRGLKSFHRRLVAPKANTIGWTFCRNDTHLQQRLKSLLFQHAAFAGDGKVTRAALEMYQAYRKRELPAIHPSLRKTVLAVALLESANVEEDYNFILTEFRNCQDSKERGTALEALGRAWEPALIQRTLALLLSDEVKAQDFHFPIQEMVTSREGLSALWEWFKLNIRQVEAKFMPGWRGFGKLMECCISSFTSLVDLEQVEDFFEHQDTKPYHQSLARGLDEIRVKVKWVESGREDVREWLEARGLCAQGPEIE